MTTALAIASFVWSIVSMFFKSINWASPKVWCVLAFVGGCQFDRSFLWHPKAAPSVVSPDNPSPRKPILPWRASEAGAAEREKKVHIINPDGTQEHRPLTPDEEEQLAPMTEEEFAAFVEWLRTQPRRSIVDGRLLPFEPTPDPISDNDGLPQPADETRPKSSELLDQLNADLNARMNFEPNPKPKGSPATSCGPRGCPPSAGGGGSSYTGGGIFRRGIFRRR